MSGALSKVNDRAIGLLLHDFVTGKTPMDLPAAEALMREAGLRLMRRTARSEQTVHQTRVGES